MFHSLWGSAYVDPAAPTFVYAYGTEQTEAEQTWPAEHCRHQQSSFKTEKLTIPLETYSKVA
jgi:hypothetical protein